MTKHKYTVRYATKKDFDFFYKGEPLLYSARAWVLCKKREKYAIGGLWLMKGQNMAFLKVTRNLPKKEFWKNTKSIFESLKKENISISCYRDEEMLNSKKLLDKLGFKQIGILDNKEIYRIWAPQQFL